MEVFADLNALQQRLSKIISGALKPPEVVVNSEIDVKAIDIEAFRRAYGRPMYAVGNPEPVDYALGRCSLLDNTLALDPFPG